MNNSNFATKSQRALAFFIDGIVAAILLVLITKIVGYNSPTPSNAVKMYMENPIPISELSEEMIQELTLYQTKLGQYSLGLLGVFLLTYLTYVISFSVLVPFQTLGRLLTNIKIVKCDNTKANSNNILLRDLVGFTLSLTCFLWVVSILKFFTEVDTGMLHDNIAKVKMISLKEETIEEIEEENEVVNSTVKIYLDEDILKE